MGFRDAEWAYSVDRPLAETAVLAALALRTDDDTHETFVGQQTIATMLGASVEKVLRALRDLERDGVITRTRRHGQGGYRTSDLIRVNADTYMANDLQGESPTRQNAYKENRRHLPDDSSPPTWQKVTAEEITQLSPSDHPVVVPQPKRATRIPDPFLVSREMWAWAAERAPLVDATLSTERFVNHWRAKAGRDASKLDWERTWHNWLLNDQERAAERKTKTKPLPTDRAIDSMSRMLGTTPANVTTLPLREIS